MSDTSAIVASARRLGLALPAFNIPYLPMVEPVLAALRDSGTFGLVEVARVEWEKFEAKSLEAVAEEYRRHDNRLCSRLHLDHVPVIDEDGLRVDFLPIIRRALAAGFESVMVDGSRLPFDENVAAARSVVELCSPVGVAVEAELGSVLGHEAGPLPPYEELFRTGTGFTDPADAAKFAAATGVDWLSVAIGNVHGAVAESARKEKKIEARLDLERLSKIYAAAGVPIVLHGGTGIKPDNVRAAVARGIAKINIGTGIRAPYEAALARGPAAAREAAYRATLAEIETLGLGGSAARLVG
ncbi:MAG TPA: class II fructose-bisphosphate aldolase [Rectinemataceae bacterium]|nr:class II fructose-bisphosphate aldolase [Rectinemataceae bacterium]